MGTRSPTADPRTAGCVMKITCGAIEQLTADQLAAWSRFQSADPKLHSPYFRPEFAQAVETVRKDVEVAVLEVDGAPAGFWPFQRTRWNTAKPVGGRMSDFQGVVGQKGLRWNAEELIRGCGLAAWDFDHLLAWQQSFRANHWKTAPSPYMDLSGGFNCYRSTAHAQTISQALRKRRKLEREIGPLRLEAHTADPSIFKTLIYWKTKQYHSTGASNIFALGWTVALLENIFCQQHESFSGVLTALYAGEQLAAVHFGMRSKHVLHCWFPAYNQSLHRYSPGLVLWIELARSAATLGIRRIDLGKGAEQYKSSLMSGSVDVAEGFVACRPMARFLRHGSRDARALVRSLRLGNLARLLRRIHAWQSIPE